MAGSSVRRSFHGPWLSSGSGSGAVRRPARVPVAPPLELVPEPPSAGALGRALLSAARAEQPTSHARERILSQVLSALQRLTSEQSRVK